MKHKFLNVLVIMILFVGAIFSCRQEAADLFKPGDKIIEDVQQWYEKNKPSQGIGMKSADLNEKKHNAKPDWKHAFSRKHSDFTSVMVPLSMQGAFAFVTPECKRAYEQTHDKRYLQTLTEMVVVTEKGNTMGFVMTIIPDKAYREANNFKAYASSYKRWQKDFSGYIFYHTLEGEFTNGWRFESGKPVKKVSQKSRQGIGLQLKSAFGEEDNGPECYDFYVEIWSQDCTDWYTITETSITYDGTSCSGWYYDGIEYLYTECYYDEPFNGGYIPFN